MNKASETNLGDGKIEIHGAFGYDNKVVVSASYRYDINSNPEKIEFEYNNLNYYTERDAINIIELLNLEYHKMV